MATEETTISDLELTEDILPDMLTPVENASETKATTFSAIKNWLASFFVRKTGSETISGIKTFIDSINKDLGNYTNSATVSSNTWYGLFGFKSKQERDYSALMQVGKTSSGYNNLNINMKARNGEWSRGLNIYAGVNIQDSYVQIPASDKATSALSTEAITKARKGYIKLGNGLILNWGYDQFLSGGSTVSFSYPYSNKDYILLFGHYQGVDDTSSFATGITADILNTANFKAHGWQKDKPADKYCFWLALGW